MDTVTSVLIVGGTHGNETSGLGLVHPDMQQRLLAQHSSLNLAFDLANPNAIARNIRFTEEDLNRQFTQANLADSGGCYEARRARELNLKWGPKQASKTDLVIDIHNTTAAMGATLIILELDAFHIGLARYVHQHMPEAIVLVEDEETPEQHPYLCTIGKRGVMVEVGAQPQGVYRADVMALAHTLTNQVLDYCSLYNQQDSCIEKLAKASAYRLGDIVHYPGEGGHQRNWMIHPDLQDADYSELNTGDPVFISLSGEVMSWQGELTFPHFINEAAYHKQNVAFATAAKIEI